MMNVQSSSCNIRKIGGVFLIAFNVTYKYLLGISCVWNIYPILLI